MQNEENPFTNIQIPQVKSAEVKENQETQPPVSKSKLKKLKRKQLWQQAKKTKKIKKKQQKKLNQLNKPKPQTVIGPKEPIVYQKKRKQDYVQKIAEGIRVAIDLQFFKQMTQKQQNSLFKQLTHCHSQNRNAELAMNLIFTSTTEQIQQLLNKKFTANNWGISMTSNSLLQQFKSEEIVYLTGDAEEVIGQLQKDKVYIIGGIVDHNRLKKITYNYSIENKIAMKRFPLLGQQISLKTNAHLAVNHVFGIMLNVYNGSSWESAINEAIPSRKLQQKFQTNSNKQEDPNE